eukprot:Filipodium_phascolosomae@DN4471_c0_g1_i1.p1
MSRIYFARLNKCFFKTVKSVDALRVNAKTEFERFCKGESRFYNWAFRFTLTASGTWYMLAWIVNRFNIDDLWVKEHKKWLRDHEQLECAKTGKTHNDTGKTY